MDWFRRKTWTEADKQDFNTRLKRARTAKRAQYIRIQAGELLELKTEQSTLDGIDLLHRMLAEYPQPSEMAAAYNWMGRAYENLKQTDQAILSYQKAMDQQRIYPQIMTNVHSFYAQLVARQKLRALYADAILSLDQWNKHDDLIPFTKFRACSARALILFDQGEKTLAHQYAGLAINVSKAVVAGLRFHKKDELEIAEHTAVLTEMKLIFERTTP